MTWAPPVFDARCESLARFVAHRSGLYAPGLTFDDLVQEARIGIWKAIRDYQPDRGAPFVAFAHLCALRQIQTAVKTANTGKHRLLNQSERLDAPIVLDGKPVFLADIVPDPGSDPADRFDTSERLRRVIRGVGELSSLERECVLRVAIDGEAYEQVGPYKQVDNAIQRARRKLRAAAA